MASILTEKYRRLKEDWDDLKKRKVVYANQSAKLEGLEREQRLAYNLYTESDLIVSRYLGQNLRSVYNDNELKEVQDTISVTANRLSELTKEIPELREKITKDDIAENGTTDPEYAIKVFGAGKVGALLRCTYCELYLADGTKVFSMQRSAFVNNKGSFLFLITGTKYIDHPEGRRPQTMVEVELTRAGYEYLTSYIERFNDYTDGSYAKIVPYLFIETPTDWQRSYKPIKFYIPMVALRYYPDSNSTTADYFNEIQPDIISHYETDEHNRIINEEIERQQQEIAKKKKQILLLTVAAGAISLLALN